MINAVCSGSARITLSVFLAVATIILVLPVRSTAQLMTFSKQDLIDYTAANPFDRFPDGRPKVPDALLERARDLSAEDIWATMQDKGYNNQYADGFIVLKPGKTMVGRVFSVQFMPVREDLASVAEKKAKERGIPRLTNQTAIDMLQPGDVLVVDLFGKKVNGTIVGDNLFYYVMTATHKGGLIVDGSIRDLMESRKSICPVISVRLIPRLSAT
jgi:regulator of RNase E activity RraA